MSAPRHQPQRSYYDPGTDPRPSNGSVPNEPLRKKRPSTEADRLALAAADERRRQKSARRAQQVQMARGAHEASA